MHRKTAQSRKDPHKGRDELSTTKDYYRKVFTFSGTVAKGKRKNLSDYYTDEIKERATYIFGPFLNKYDYRFPEEWGSVKIPLTSKYLFVIMGVFRKINERIKKHSKRKSISGSIYGEIQRGNTP